MSELSLKEMGKFLSSPIKLTYENLIQYLKFNNFNPLQTEAMKELIKLKIEKNPEWLKIFLLLITGKSYIPTNGYTLELVTIIDAIYQQMGIHLS